MLDETLANHLDEAWGDPDTWVAEGLQWTHLEAVRAAIARRVSADPGINPLHWFVRHVAARQPLPLRRVLVLGCGPLGQVERVLVAEGLADEVVAVDLSLKVLNHARQQAGPSPRILYLQADMNELPLGPPPFAAASFDAVFGVSSVHHCERLEALYAKLHALLRPAGWLYLDEYVGPERFQFDAAHMALVNRIVDALPDRLVTTRSGHVRRGFSAPAPQEVVAVDPTEAVNSTRIIPALRPWFEVEAVRPYGGALLQVLLAEIAQNFTGAQTPWLEALIQAEDDTMRMGQLKTQFACVIARARSAASLPPSPDR